MLKIQNLNKTFDSQAGTVLALQSISFSVSPGEFVAIRGHSGCGKSTLLLSAGGLLAPDAGQILIDGQDIYALPGESRARLRSTTIGFVFQRFHLVPYLNVLDNVLAPSLATPTNNASDHARELLDQFGMTDRLTHYPAQLSTGERQRTALARALLNCPRLLLADEPTGNLDPDNAQIVLAAIAHFAHTGGAVLLVTHDAEAAALATRTLIMKKGELVTGNVPVA